MSEVTEKEKEQKVEEQPKETTEAVTKTEAKQIQITSKDSSKRAMYLIKEFLLNNEEVEIVARTAGSPTAVRASESLVRLGYVTYEKVKTDTTLLNRKRNTKLIIKLKRTANFKPLYDENEEIRKKTQEIDNTF